MNVNPNILTLVLVCLGLSTTLPAQTNLATHNDFSANTLVRDVFASGACETISQISRIGSQHGVGYFENGADIIGLDRGIILSTGPTNVAPGPNSDNDVSGTFNDQSGDSDLSLLATGQVHDAVGIEFDFSPLDSFVTFRYVFASEEYCEFVGSDYNDVFGFFIRGPGINGGFTGGAENVALIPGSSDFVSINTVNHQQNQAFYVHNELPEDIEDCNLGNINTPHINGIEYDGFTTVLTAVLKLRPCETYHIRLVVGDVGDEFFDSAVFLEAGSFNLGGQVRLTAHGGGAGNGQLYEGCDDAYFRFDRSDEGGTDFPLTVGYTLGASATATSGVDFVALDGEVTIPAGEAFVDLPITSLIDEEAEEPELLQLVLDIPCACYSDTAAVWIIDPLPLESASTDGFFCPGQAGTLTAAPLGGIAPYTYSWSHNESGQTVPVPPQDGTSYNLTITDACGHMLVDTLSTSLVDPPTAVLTGEAEICEGDTARLVLQLEGTAPFEVTYTLDGMLQDPQSIDVDSLLILTRGGAYELISVSDAACTGEAEGTAEVTEMIIGVDSSTMAISCFGGNDGGIAVSLSGGTPPFDYSWQENVPDQLNLNELAAGTYHLNIVDSRMCEKLVAFELTEPPPITAPEVDCAGLAEGISSFTAGGGVSPYLYREPGGDWRTEEWLSELNPAQEYQLEIQDANGCEAVFDWLVPSPFPNGMAELPSRLTLSLGERTELQPSWLIPIDLISAVEWVPAEHLSCADCENPVLTAVQSGVLELQVMDVFGCVDSIGLEIKVEDRLDVFLPSAFSPDGDQVNDIWSIYGNPYQIERIEQVLIFDRWGGLLYQATDLPLNSDRHGWDGTRAGQALDAGVYVYMVEFQLVNGQRRVLGGDVTLMR